MQIALRDIFKETVNKSSEFWQAVFSKEFFDDYHTIPVMDGANVNNYEYGIVDWHSNYSDDLLIKEFDKIGTIGNKVIIYKEWYELSDYNHCDGINKIIGIDKDGVLIFPAAQNFKDLIDFVRHLPSGPTWVCIFKSKFNYSEINYATEVKDTIAAKIEYCIIPIFDNQGWLVAATMK